MKFQTHIFFNLSLKGKFISLEYKINTELAITLFNLNKDMNKSDRYKILGKISDHYHFSNTSQHLGVFVCF